MKKIYLFLISAVAMMLGACTDDLNQQPIIGTTSTDVYSTADGYKQVLAKIYACYAIVGQERADNADLTSNNGQDLLRNYFNLQEAPTDETAMRWLSGDNLTNLAYMRWDANDSWVADTYYRLYYNIALCNEFLRYCGDSNISGFTSTEQENIKTYAAEARYVRALSYYLVLDLFRQGPFVDENCPTSSYIPEAYDGTQLFNYIESEIKDVEDLLPAENEYGRASRGAAWALAAKLYLNAEVYTGTGHYTDCLTYCNKILSSGKYSLEADYSKLFNADNYKRTNEIIFSFVTDATTTTSWGAGTYLVCGSCGSDSSQDPSKYGISNGWGSWRVRGEFSALWDDVNNTADSRCMLWTDGQAQYLDKSLDEGTQGYYAEKWTNLTDAGDASSDSGAYGCDTDFIMFRLGDVYLMAAEAVLRGGSGMTRSEGLALINALRERAYGDNSGNIADTQYTLPFILNERGRELYLECSRRTDLVRFGCFTTADYVWQWKGGVVDGRSVDSKYNIYPIPSSELSANPNLSNPNY
jgi:hypothetical protein